VSEAETPAKPPSLWTRVTVVIGEGRRLNPTGALGALIAALSIAAAVVVTWLALFGTETEHMQISWFILLVFPIVFLTTTAARRVARLGLADYALAVAAAAVGLWFIVNDGKYQAWAAGFSRLTTGDVVAGTALVLLSIEMCRRCVGLGLTLIVGALLAYVAFGQHLVGSFRHDGITYDYFLEMQTVTTDGIFGTPLYVSASYAFLFVLFGNFFVVAGGGQLFFDFAAALTGRLVGGPAKACIVSSAFYGSISGSPVADVATTGPISIPIMRKIGISAERAGAIEAAASTGGALLPPVMGAVAFLMADFTGIPYNLIAWYATAPCIGYYVGVYALVHFEARRFDLGRVPEDQIIGLKLALKNNWPSLLPIVALIWLLIAGYSAAYVAAGSTVSVLVASWLKRETAIGPKRFVQACVETCHSMVPLAAAVAAAGIIIGSIELTGLSGKFTLLLFQASGGYFIPSLIIAAVVLVLLGMGMPTTGVYIMGIALLAPVLVSKFHVPLMEAHMFMLFYASMSAITPPVAVACFAAASIAGASPFRIAPYACKLSVGGFALPFFFIFNPGILKQGTVIQVLSDCFIGMALVVTLSLALHGWIVKRRLPLLLRFVIFGAGIGMMYPDWRVQYALTAVVIGLYYALRPREGSPVPASSSAG
jgi:TRAP transporter 4TM/12TM fusion protein